MLRKAFRVIRSMYLIKNRMLYTEKKDMEVIQKAKEAGQPLGSGSKHTAAGFKCSCHTHSDVE